jgi:Lon protease-like protein
MSRSPFFPRFRDLPASIPVFPLPGVLLLPRGQLPLNIFEPRYVAMVDDAVAKERLIGMMQPRELVREDSQNPVRDGAPLYDIGCAGRITSFEETDDGRYLVTLTGICRFRVAGEVATLRGYRRFAVDWSDYAADLAEDAPAGGVDRTRLLSALADYFRVTGLSANWKAIEETPDDRLVTSLAMICPFDASEKQALLEAPDLGRRADLILSVLELAAHRRPDGAGDGPAVRH